MDELESPQRSYNVLLVLIRDNLAESEMNDFEFALRSDLPTTVLEVRKPLKWFSELEKRCLLSPDDLSRLENALGLAHLNLLLEDVRRFQAKRRVVVFFQKCVEEKIAGLRLDNKFKQSCILSKQLPLGFQKKCQELTLDQESTTCTIQDLQSLLSNGVELLVNHCSSHSDLDSVAMKVLYLSDIVFQRFERIIVDRMDMLKDYLSGYLPLLPTIYDRERLPAENGPGKMAGFLFYVLRHSVTLLACLALFLQ